jgi:DNA-binding CsgD family transcriptional regulator
MDDRLCKRDWELLLDALYRINAAKDLPTYAQEALDCLETLISCDQATFFPLSSDGKFCPEETLVSGEKALYLDEFMNGGYSDEIFFKIMNVKMYSNAVRDTDVISDAVRLNSRVFKEIYVPQGIHFALRLTLYSQGRILGQFALFNAKKHGDFSEKALRLGNLIVHHLALKLELLRAQKLEPIEIQNTTHALQTRFNLTPRESQIVSMVADGLSENEVAERLFVSLSTVKKHIYNAYLKVGVNNRTQLIRVILDKSP